MSDLIDRQAAIACCTFGRTSLGLIDELRRLPSAEPKIIHCEDCKYGMLDLSFPHQWFCKFKGDEWNNNDYFCGHAKKREVME